MLSRFSGCYVKTAGRDCSELDLGEGAASATHRVPFQPSSRLSPHLNSTNKLDFSILHQRSPHLSTPIVVNRSLPFKLCFRGNLKKCLARYKSAHYHIKSSLWS